MPRAAHPVTLGPEHLASLAAARQADVLRREVFELRAQRDALREVAVERHEAASVLEAENERLRSAAALGPIMTAAASLGEVEEAIVTHLWRNAHDCAASKTQWPAVVMNVGFSEKRIRTASTNLQERTDPIIETLPGRSGGVYLLPFGVEVAKELEHRAATAADSVPTLRAHRA
jgi:hypothetical protein